MDTHLSKNSLIGLTTADTLANLSAVVVLLRNVKVSEGMSEESEHGLFMIYTLVRDSLEYELDRLKID